MAWLLPPERDIGVLKAPIRSTLILLGLFLFVILAFGLLERLGVDLGLAPVGVIGAAVSLFVVAALLSHSRRAVDFYLADRKTSSAFSGLAGAAALAGILTIGLAGGAYVAFPDFLVAAAGLAAGFLLMAVMLAPGLRRVGAYSAGDYLAARYGGVWVRFTFATVAFVVCFLLLVAHLKVTAPLFATVIGLTPAQALYGAAGVTVLAVLPGGMRSLTWTQAIQYFVVLFGCLVPAGSLIVHGAAGDIAVEREFATLLSEALPDWESGNAASGTVLPFLLAAFGAASLPILTARSLTAASSRGALLSIGWAAVYGLVLVAVGLLLALLLDEAGDWDAANGLLQVAALFASLPAVLAGLVLAGVLAALFAVGVAALFAATSAISHDLWDEILDKRGPEGRRILIARVTLILVAAAAAALVPVLNVEPSALLRWALALSAAGGIAPIVIGLVWKRALDIGAIGGMVAGFGFAGLAFVLEQSRLFGGAEAGGLGMIGAPTAALVGL
ncbi:MAG: sodium:solute symporter family transporter, partial [Propylenella sp.]